MTDGCCLGAKIGGIQEIAQYAGNVLCLQVSSVLAMLPLL